MMILTLTVAVLLFLGITKGLWQLLTFLKPESKIHEKGLKLVTFYALIIFIVVLGNHTTPYYKDIDPFVDPCYSPISYENSALLIALHIMALFSMYFLYSKGNKLPPLQILIFIFFLITGIILNGQFIYQVSFHDLLRINGWQDGNNVSICLAMYPIFLIICSLGIIVNMIRTKAKLNYDQKYENKWLNAINELLLKTNNLPLISVLISIPVLVLLVLILVLFGQDAELLTKVYSETATWKLSQHIHPPTVDDRHGHYLCTVAALGTPAIVKPITIGIRNNLPILVNRQLQIANAFEQIIEEVSPYAHKFIRTNYDKYGLNLAKKINTEKLSNLTYYMMKPLEWVFLISIYSYYTAPEGIISSQYKSRPNQ